MVAALLDVRLKHPTVKAFGGKLPPIKELTLPFVRALLRRGARRSGGRTIVASSFRAEPERSPGPFSILETASVCIPKRGLGSGECESLVQRR